MRRLTAATALLLALLAGCTNERRPPTTADGPADATPSSTATAEPAPRRFALWSGEHLVAEVSTAGVAVGQYQLWVGQPCLAEDRPALPVTSKAERLGLYAAFEESGADAISWVDAATGSPVQMRSTIISGKHTKNFLVVFDDDHYDYIYERNSSRGMNRHFRTARIQPTPPHVPVHDMHSTLGLLRTWAGEIGTRGVVHTVVGRHLYRLEVQVAEKERIETAGTTYDSIRIDGVARRFNRKGKLLRRRQPWSLWLSDEPIRMPIRAQLEARHRSYLAELLDYRSPSTPAASPSLGACEGLADADRVEQEARAQARERRDAKRRQSRSQSRVDM